MIGRKGAYRGLSRCTAALSKLAHPQQICQRPLCSRRDLRRHPADLVLAHRQNLRRPIRGIRRSIRTPDVNLPGSGIGISVRDSWTEVNVEKGTVGSRRSVRWYFARANPT
ncbi:hypothetical protein EAG_14762 [Camponotus floridanus]|uniref:Uncharacterized protein n=1 Tax=Camponotus floridanus TaxID=104421 RepID=E2A576_CAMFO|nr:hypothetical protein EAG_14762 [Camponotus floridanus]